ncbi:RICIN domain-containing protein [Mucilaginibacter angelicae]|uniref:RICIN domain-containing protein n=1 Tax=Mucilaginibacter angelicae TaxID=869718 RepID=A0ABV6L2X3_9SPHI
MKLRTLCRLLVTAAMLPLLSCAKKNLPEPAAESGLEPGVKNRKMEVQAANGLLDDTNIKYFGRWDFSNPAQYVSNWGGAYIKVNFTGTTVKIKVGNTNNYFARIDGGAWVTYNNVSGTVNLTPTPLSAGTHTLIVAEGKDYDYEFKFEGLILDAGAATAAPSVSNYLIEYIGDSITAGFKDSQANVSAYGWVCAEGLNSEHTQIAWPGIKLISGTSSKGMDYQYLRLKGNYNDPTTTATWDFTKYTPQIVVVNLGTNDNPAETSDAAFQSAYTSFLATIRSKFPNAEIFAMRTYVGVWENATLAAVNARITAGDSKVHFVNTSGWLTANTSDYLPGDNTHPSESGHIKAGNLLKSIISPYAGGSALIANGTYKIVNRNSGLVLEATGQGTGNGTAIEQWSYNGGDNQKWVVTNLGGNTYKIIGVQSGRSLDVNGQSLIDGAAIQLYDYNGGDNQKWTITPTTGGYVTISGVQSGKLAEVEGQSTAAGALVKQWTSNGGTNQQWIFQAP